MARLEEAVAQNGGKTLELGTVEMRSNTSGVSDIVVLTSKH